MCSAPFVTKPTAESLVALFCPQFVCDLVSSLQNSLLSLSWPYFTLREYVIWSLHHKPTADLFWPCSIIRKYVILSMHCETLCWTCCGPFPPSESMWSGFFTTTSTAEPSAPSFLLQEVCDVVISSHNPLLNLLHSCSSLSEYAIWFFHHKIYCWTFTFLFCP